MCQVGFFNEGRSSSVAIWLSKECKQVFNKACTMPWCDTVVHVGVKMSRFFAIFRDDHPDISKASGFSSTVISNAFSKTRTQLGHSRKF